MAASSLLLLIDDIATLLDDVALMTKVAARQGLSAADDVNARASRAKQGEAGQRPHLIAAAAWRKAANSTKSALVGYSASP